MTVTADNKAIKIPESHYVGFNKRGDAEIPLGFMTPDGTDQAAAKRKATVDRWANDQTQLPAQTYENKALSGFKFGNSVRHYSGWGQGNVKWRVEDPRGFELEITSPNLAQIMAVSTLENGEILEKCIWGRLGNDNVLIPVTSDVYKAATANTERMNKTASMKDLKIGYYAILQNGEEGRYMGSHFEIYAYGYRWQGAKKKKHTFMKLDADGKPTSIFDYASPKLSEIREGEELTIDQAEDVLNDFGVATNSNYRYSKLMVKDEHITREIEEFDLSSHVPKTSYRDYVFVLNSDGLYLEGDLYYINMYSGQGRAQEYNAIKLDKWLENGAIEYVEKPVSMSSLWGRSSYSDRVRAVINTADTTLRYFWPRVSYVTGAGRKITV